MTAQPTPQPPPAADQDQDQDATEPFEVILGPNLTFLGVFAFSSAAGLAGVMIVADAFATPPDGVGDVLARLFQVGWGLLLAGLFGGGMLVWLGQLITGRPVIILDAEGVRLPLPWPRSRKHDRVLAWWQVSRVHAYTHLLYSRGGTHRQHFLAFVPVPNLDLPGMRPASRLERWAVRTSSAPSVEAMRFAVPVQPGWTATVEEVAAEACARKRALRFVDDRNLPPRRLRRWLRGAAARLRLAPPVAEPPMPRLRRVRAWWHRLDPEPALLTILVAGLIGLLGWMPGLIAASWEQTQIDRHQIRVTGVIASVHYGHSPITVQAVYTIDGRRVTSDPIERPMFLLTGDPVCLEVDAKRPSRARVCGTRGDAEAVDFAIRFWGVISVGSAVLLLIRLLIQRLVSWRSR
jgi:hypothetical protein